MGLRLVLLVVLLCAGRVPVARAIDPGTAAGSLTIGGETTILTHAYAHFYDNAEGLDEHPELRLLVTDREVPQSYLAGPVLLHLDSLARAGEVRGVLLKLDPRGPAGRIHGTVLYRPQDPNASMIFFSADGDANARTKWNSQRFVGEVEYASGTAETVEADTDEVTEALRAVPPFRFSATISAPVFRDPPLTATLSGRRAMDSPQGEAFLAFERAIRAGDLDAARPWATPAAMYRIEALLAGSDEASFRAWAERMVLPEAERRSQPWKLYVRDSTALLVIDGKDQGGDVIQSLVRGPSGWLVD